MNYWTQFLRRPRTIEDLYYEPPSLTDFELSKINWERDEHACMLQGTLAQFPDFPRSGWENDANRLGIQLWLEQLGEFSMQGLAFEQLIDIQLHRDGATGLIVEASGEQLEFRAVCTSLHVPRVFAYPGTEPEAAN